MTHKKLCVAHQIPFPKPCVSDKTYHDYKNSLNRLSTIESRQDSVESQQQLTSESDSTGLTSSSVIVLENSLRKLTKDFKMLSKKVPKTSSSGAEDLSTVHTADSRPVSSYTQCKNMMISDFISSLFYLLYMNSYSQN